MFYHIFVAITGISNWYYFNLTSEQVFSKYLCPFLNNERTLIDGRIFNLSSYGSMRVFQTDKPVDSDWPVKKKPKQTMLEEIDYQEQVTKAFKTESKEVTNDFYKKALILLQSGEYKELRLKLLENILERYSFFICPVENKEVDHNYEFVIKPIVRQFQFKIERATEISHTKAITEVILDAIARSRFIVADLTDERQNCYYELGYAHALGKPVIILAKDGTLRHFDIAAYKWNYWTDYIDLKPKFEKELVSLLKVQGFKTE